MIKYVVINIFSLATMIYCHPASGQAKHQKQIKDSMKIPHITATLGDFPGGGLPKMKTITLLDDSLSAKDEHGKRYKVISFDFGYEKVDTFFNDSTEKLQLFRNYLSNSYQSNKLDTLWSHRIQEYLSAGEKLFFDQIIVEDTAKGIKYEADPFKINVE